MHKELHILGLLLEGPKTGYDIHRIVVAHGALFTDLKKGNVYYLLERLASEGFLQISTEAGARGPRRQRMIYALTERGRAHFAILLREVLRTYELAHTGVEVGIVFMQHLPVVEVIALLEQRRQAVLDRRASIAIDAGAAHQQQLRDLLAHDHMLCLMDAELTWIDRTITQLHESPETGSTDKTVLCPGSHPG